MLKNTGGCPKARRPLVEDGVELGDAAVGAEQLLQVSHVILKQPLAGDDGGRALRRPAQLVLLALIVAGLAVLVGVRHAVPGLGGVDRCFPCSWPSTSARTGH